MMPTARDLKCIERFPKAEQLEFAMQLATNLYVIGREGNVVLVDFSKRRSPRPPWFPGADGLRILGSDELTSDLSSCASP